MYFGKDHTPSCDEVCSNCAHTQCLDHPDFVKARRLDWEGEPRECAFCGKTFIPTSPAQRYCSPGDDPDCDTQRFLSSLTPLQYIRYAGYRNKEEFIRDNGQDAWEAIRNLPDRTKQKKTQHKCHPRTETSLRGRTQRHRLPVAIGPEDNIKQKTAKAIPAEKAWPSLFQNN